MFTKSLCILLISVVLVQSDSPPAPADQSGTVLLTPEQKEELVKNIMNRIRADLSKKRAQRSLDDNHVDYDNHLDDDDLNSVEQSLNDNLNNQRIPSCNSCCSGSIP